MRDQAGASENGDAADGAETADPSDVDIDSTNTAQVSIPDKPENHQVLDMESIKALLRRFLDDIKEPQKERSLYLEDLLSQWLDLWRRDRTHTLLIYVLGDGGEQYKDRKFDVNDLGTMDKIRTKALEQQCLQIGVCLLLAKMTSTIDTDPDDALGLNMAVSLDEIRDLNGSILVNNPFAVGSESVIQKNILRERYNHTIARQNPHAGPAVGTRSLEIDNAKSFQDWVLLLMPEGCRFKFLADNADPQALHDWIKSSSADLQPLETNLAWADSNVRWGLTLACKNQLNNISTWLASKSSSGDRQGNERQSDMLTAVVCASFRLRDPDLFRMAVVPNPRMVFLIRWEEVGSAIDLAQFSLYRKSLGQALTKIDSFQDRYIILWSIRTGCETQIDSQVYMQDVKKWIEKQIEQTLNDVEQVEQNDGALLVRVAKKSELAIGMYRITCFAKKHSSNQAFAIEFAFSLYDELVGNTMDSRSSKYALAEILSAAIPALCGRDFYNWNLYQEFSSSTSGHAPVKDLPMLQADSMARLVRCCLTVGLYNEEVALLGYMWRGASLADIPTLQHVFLPYLKQLLAVMRDYHIPLTTQKYQWQFQHVIFLFITRYIGKEPTPPSADLTCPPLGCASTTRPYGCSTCLELDAFLVDPHRETADITGGIEAPEHVSAQIQDLGCLHMTIVSYNAAQMRPTMRITKTMAKSEEPDAMHELWKERVIKANGLLQAICGDEDWKLLLDHRYDECMGLKAVRTGGDAQ